MATINGIEPIDAYWYRTNFNQILLTVLDSGGNVSNLDVRGFRYTCDKSTSIDLNDVYMEYSITSYSPVDSNRGPLPLPITFKTGIETSRHGSFNDNIEVDELVVYYANDGNSNVSITTNKYSTGYFSPISSNTAFSNFAIMVRTKDGQIIDYWNNRELAIDKIHSGNLHMVNGSVCVSIPYDYDSTGYYYAYPYSAYGCINSYWETHEQSISFKCSHKVCKSKASAYKYLKFGIDDGLEELDTGEDEEIEVESDTYFYECFNEYYSDLALTNHIASTTQKYKITFEDFPKGTTPVYAKVNNEKYINNVQFMVHDGYGEYITSASTTIGNIEVPITENILSTFMGIRTNYGIIYDSTNDRYCKTTVYTNMPIIGVDGNAVPGRIPDSDDMIGAENGANYDCGLSECWLLDTENVSKLASIFNTTIDRSSSGASELVLAEWVQGLSCYSNPLDVVCDLFYMPINVSDYITGSSKAFTLQPSING